MPRETGSDSPSSFKKVAQDVRLSGDTLDRVRGLQRIQSLGYTAAIGAGIEGFYHGFYYTSIGTVPSRIGIALATGLAAAAVSPAVNAYERRRTTEALGRNQDASEAVGVPVEFFSHKNKLGRSNKKDLDMRVYIDSEDGHVPPDNVIDILKKAKEVGEDSGVTSFVLPNEVVSRFNPDDKDDVIGEKVHQRDWLYDIKKRDLYDEKEGDNELLIVTPSELEALLSNVEVVKKGEPLDTIMRQLKKISPDHPSHAWYAQYINNTEVARLNLTRIFTKAIETGLEDVSVDRIKDDEATPGRRRIYRIGKITDGEGSSPLIEWQGMSEWTQHEYTDLLDHNHIAESDIKEVLANPDAYTMRRVKEVCEVAAFLTLKGHTLDIVEGVGDQGSTPKRDEEDRETETPLQQRVVESVHGKKGKRWRRKKEKNGISIQKTSFGRRLGRSAAMIAATAAIGYGLGEHAEYLSQGISDRADQIRQVEADEKDIPLYETDITAAYEQARKEDPVYYAYQQLALEHLGVFDEFVGNTVTNVLQKIGAKYTPDELKDFVDNNLDETDCSLCSSVPGNINQKPNTPEWYLESVGGMDSSGYWAEQVLNRTDYDGVLWDSNLSYRDDEIDQAIDAAQPLPTPDYLPEGPYIKVSRTVVLNTINGKRLDGNRVLYPVPVLEGTHVAAAAINNNETASVVSFADGTQGIILSYHADPTKVEYYVVPGDSIKTHATRNIQPREEIPLEDINQLWTEKLGQPLPDDPKERIGLQESVLQGFGYRLAPLPNNSVIFDKYAFAQQALNGDVANCNVANGLLAISNPDELNGAIGHLNNNSSGDEEYLSAGEKHFWTVSHDGEIFDGTPSDVLPEEKEAFTENFDGETYVDPAEERRDSFLNILGGIGLIAAGGVGLWQRRRLASAYNALHSRLLSIQVNAISTENLTNAYGALNNALYNENSTDGQPIIIEDIFGQSLDRETLLTQFARYTGHNTILADNNNQTSEDLRRAQRVINLLASKEKLAKKKQVT